MSAVRFEIELYCGKYRWNLYHQNGTLLAQSKGYSRKSDAKRAITRLKKVDIAYAEIWEPEATVSS